MHLTTITTASIAQILLLATTALGSGSDCHLSESLCNILANTHQSPLYRYRTDLTRDIIPKGVHSHNDYWRDVPFYSALSVGAVSIEADVWLYNETLYVGHDPEALTKERTLEALYINPILDTLQRQNPETPFTKGPSKNGVYDTRPSQTLYLFVDVKTDGPTTWPYVIKALEPLRKADYLTTYRSGNPSPLVVQRPITVIGTGNTPLSQIESASERDYFYDAPLGLLNTTGTPPTGAANLTNYTSPIASASFSVQIGSIVGNKANANHLLNDTQLARLRAQVATAHTKRMAVRYWNLPAWPIATRDALWKLLVDEGVDLINADDLRAAAGDSGRGRFW